MGHHQLCQQCGRRFTAQRASRRFCSSACRLLAHRRRWNDPTEGELSRLLREVADSVDKGLVVRNQLRRLRTMMHAYEAGLESNK